jgi:integral membrane protein
MEMINDARWKWFLWIGTAEALSFLLLLGIAMPMKYIAGIPQAVSIVGMAHGVLFVAYLLMIHICRVAFGWSLLAAALGAVASVVPFGPWVYERWLKKKYMRLP